MVALSEIKIGQQAEVQAFMDSDIKCYSARFGIEEGQVVRCIAKPGAIVLQKNKQEIAIGKKLCKEISVRLI